MVCLPIAVFYLFYYFVFDMNPEKLGWCGVAAVVAANVVSISYVHMAYYEDKEGDDATQEKSASTKKTD